MWHVELKHTFYKSRRDEWTLRWWKPVDAKQYREDRAAKKRLDKKMLAYINRERAVFNQPPIAPYKAEPKSYIDERGDVRAWPEIPDGEGVKDA